MDFVEQNHWGFEDTVEGWEHQWVFQVSGKRLQTSCQVSGGPEKSAGSERSVGGRSPCAVPHSCQPMDSDLLSEAGRLWIQEN